MIARGSGIISIIHMVAIEVIGNLGADVKKVEYQGSIFYSFNVSDNRKVGDTEHTMWYGCNLNRPNEKLLPYLVKGQQVYVRGIPRFRVSDSAKQHCKIVSCDIFVSEIQLVGGRPKTQDELVDSMPKSGDDAPLF